MKYVYGVGIAWTGRPIYHGHIHHELCYLAPRQDRYFARI